MPIKNSTNQNTINHNIIIGSTNNTFTSLAPAATSGVPLISQGVAANPIFGTAVVASGGTGATSFTANNLITAGTTATGPFQSVSGTGVGSNVLTSQDGANLPIWQYPTGGTVIMYAAQVTLTSAQFQSLNTNTTTINLVPAQGPGAIILPVSCFARLIYGGNNPFTGAGLIRIKLGNTGGSGVYKFTASAFLASATTYYYPTRDTLNGSSGQQPLSLIENSALRVCNTGTAYGGNAAGDNQVEFNVMYYIFKM